MEKLNYQVLRNFGYSGYILRNAPEKVMQFGEGNFLRAFVDYWFDLANEKAGWNGKCALIQPIAEEMTDAINEQEGLYTLYLRGSENGQKVDERRVISSVSRCLNPNREEDFWAMMELAVSDDLKIIISNTTEAGIRYDSSCLLSDRPAASFPGKLTQVLYARYQARKSGIIVLSCELIDDNGKELLKCVNHYITQWHLEEGIAEGGIAETGMSDNSQNNGSCLPPCLTMFLAAYIAFYSNDIFHIQVTILFFIWPGFFLFTFRSTFLFFYLAWILLF